MSAAARSAVRPSAAHSGRWWRCRRCAGAAGGAALGTSPGLWVMNSIGLVSLAKDLAARLGVAPGVKFAVEQFEVSGHQLAQVTHKRRVRLDAVHKRLKGVVVETPVPVVLGESGGRAAVMGAIPEPVSIEQEVQAFARSLLKHGQIEFVTPKGAKASAAVSIPKDAKVPRATHRVMTVNGTKMLVRVRFSCGCGH